MTVEETWGNVPALLAEHDGDPEAAAQALIDALDRDELVSMVSGDEPVLSSSIDTLRHGYNATPYPAGAVPRLGFPGIRFGDGPRGIVVGNSTAFPIPMARAATFDPALEQEVGDAIGKEGTAQGANLFGGVCINLVRHPAWGRSQETYGEDTLLLGRMGAALTESVGRHMIACVKHFALNSMENSRFVVDVRIDDADLDDIYLPHFRDCIDAGALSVMTAYNKVNGTWAGHNHRLLTETLKESWGFTGAVMSDFYLGVRNMVSALRGGLDLEMPVSLRSRRLGRAIDAGRLDEDRVRDAATRVARSVFVQASRTGAAVADRSVINCDEHRALARRVAADSIVLLTNDDVDGVPALPLGRTSDRPVSSVALIGALADSTQTGDKGSSAVRSRRVVTAAEGFRSHDDLDLRESLTDDVDAAKAAARDVDAAVVVVGNTWRDEGEYLGVWGGDRKTLRLRRDHEMLIEAVASVCPRTIVVLHGGSAFVTESWRRQVPAVVMAWYLGDEGGAALADVVLGTEAPGGRLPVTWPTDEAHLPTYKRWARRITYGPLHGYRLFHQTGRRPAFWFGHGLSYSAVEWHDPAVTADRSAVTVRVVNTGSSDAPTVVQAYVDVALGTHPDPLPTLAGFTKVRLAPGESTVVRVDLADRLVDRLGDGAVRVGPSADPDQLLLCTPPS